MTNGARAPAALQEARIREVIERRESTVPPRRDSFFDPGTLFALQDREQRMLAALERCRATPLAEKKILEVGCGSGYWLRQFVMWGARPENITGIDLYPKSLVHARHTCPQAVTLIAGNGADLPFASGSFDLVLQSTAFGMVLDGDVRRAMAAEMVRVLRPQGHILWYDAHVKNPWNPDNRAITEREIRGLFPGCQIDLEPITLIPPLTRVLARYSWIACRLLGRLPLLCTHYLGIIQPPSSEQARPARRG